MVAKQLTAARAAGAFVVAHGSDASDHAEEYLQHGIDFILLGETEQTLSRALLCIAREARAERDPGLVTPRSVRPSAYQRAQVPSQSLVDHPPQTRARAD